MTELVDILDAQGRPTGRSVPRGTFLKEDERVLYVLAIVENQEGRFLITRRALDKHWAAGWWEVPGGGVSAGETSQEAVCRELAEEVGLDVSQEDLTPIWRYENVDTRRGDNYIVDIYHFHLVLGEQDVTLQQSEAIDFRLASRQEIARLAEKGVFLHYSRLEQALTGEG